MTPPLRPAPRRRPAGRAALAALLALVLVAAPGRAAPEEPDSPGGRPHRVHALVGATVVTRPGETLEGATIVVRDGVVEAVGRDVAPPPDARVHDLRGLTVYPGLIEPYLRLEGDGGAAGDEDEDDDAPPPPAAPRRQGAVHENPAVRPDRSMADEVALDADALADLRACGFTAALLVPGQGVLRGQSALVSLRDGSAREQVVRAGVAQHVAFERSKRDYPTSLMGAVALARQALLDARHHAAARAAYAARAMGQERPEANASLDALAAGLAAGQPFVLEADDAQGLLRGVRVLGEAEVVPWVVLGGCDAYRWLPQVAATGAPLTLSLNFPPAPRWEDDDEAEQVPLDALRRWRLAPADAAGLERAGARFAFTTQGLAERSTWRARVRQAIARGLSEEAALTAFTTAPAALLRAPQLGVIAAGGIADLTITDGPLFAEHTRVVEVWVDGARYPGKPALPAPGDVAGTWALELAGRGPLAVKVAEAKGALTATFPGAAPPPPPVPARLWRDELRFVAPAAATGGEELTFKLRVAGRRARGTYELANVPGEVAGLLTADEEEEEGEAKAPAEGEAPPPPPPAPEPPPELAPRAPWPPDAPDAPAAVLVKQATLWTQGKQGTVLADLLCRDGKIVAVGPGLEAPADAVVIDGRGRHVTPGIVDCHSHAFMEGGVNEWTSSCTAEVRVRDCLDAQAVDIYRQLAGGVTTSNMLHGSANAIGGQNAVVQLRWGEPADALLLEGAPPGIKFALGENPRRANWGTGMPPRYPTSRSGVEEAIRERFLAARAYRRKRDAWREAADPTLVPPRTDLQLDALLEVLDGARLVHCHSYRQDEILSMIRLAEQQGFTIATFQHVLEGYKVAPELAAHGAGASTFSDWWAYKFEVYDAVAHNATLLARAGVLTSINSDSSEMARRLNQEAGKALRYGGLPADDALALVTLNPARQLGVGERVGSLEPGKQADFVIWSAAPLGMSAIADETWIAGRRFYSRAADAEARALVEAERAALLRAARAARWDDAEPKLEGWRPTFAAAAKPEDDERRRACACDSGRP